MTDFSIREGIFPKDKPLAIRFITGLQRFESAFEKDRRLDSTYAEDFFAIQMQRVATKHGRVFFAEDASGNALGWAIAHEAEAEVYVVPEDRIYGFVGELFVEEAARGQGVGRALMKACEDWARERGLKLIMVAALNGNDGALALYKATDFVPYLTTLRKYI
jgi:GNAT superfamily N-acetyltransferase